MSKTLICIGEPTNLQWEILQLAPALTSAIIQADTMTIIVRITPLICCASMAHNIYTYLLLKKKQEEKILFSFQFHPTIKLNKIVHYYIGA
jgi:hypothetical protein